jgi:hypothetical protein
VFWADMILFVALHLILIELSGMWCTSISLSNMRTEYYYKDPSLLVVAVCVCTDPTEEYRAVEDA